MNRRIKVRRVELKPRHDDEKYPLTHVRVLSEPASRGSFFAKRDDER